MKLIPYPELKNMTTLRMGGKGILEIVIDRVKDFELLALLLKREGGTAFIIGNGSNILAEDGDLPVLLVRISFENTTEVLREYNDRVLLRVGASVPMSRLMRFCIKNGFSGLEPLAGIPGTIGGAVFMNAGSFGCEIKDVITRATLWGEDSGVINLDTNGMEFGYRRFSPKIKDRFWCVVDVDMFLKKTSSTMVKDKILSFYLKKKARQPILSYTCGCVFKNPSPDISAGYLLEKSGMKGYRIGDVEFSNMHANFLINRGAGRAKDAWELIEIAKSRVKEFAGVELELEVKILRKDASGG